VYAGQKGALVNLDTANTILVGPVEGALFSGNPDTWLLGPLNSVICDGTKDYWGIALTGNPQVLFIPNVILWNPSPAQVQAQLQPNLTSIKAASTSSGSTAFTAFAAASRLWGFTLQASISTDASYVAAFNPVLIELRDPSGNTLLNLNLQVTEANQLDSDVVSLNLGAPIPVSAGGQLLLVIGVAPAHVNIAAASVALFSSP